MSARTRASSPSEEIPYYLFLYSTHNVFNRSTTMILDRVKIISIEVPVTLTIDRIGFYVPTVAAGNVRLGMYRTVGYIPDGGALILETASLPVASTGKFEAVIPNTQLTKGLYWLAIQHDDVTLTVVMTNNVLWQGGTVLNRRYALAYGAFTNPCPATSATDDSPAMYLRVASVP